MATSNLRKHLKRILWAFVLLAGLVVVGLRSDLPRRGLVSVLASRLGVSVTLQGLEIAGPGHFLLQGLQIHNVKDAPWLGPSSIDFLEVRAPMQNLLEGRLTSFRVQGAQLLLRDPAPWNMSGPPTPLDLYIEQLQLRDVSVEFQTSPETPPSSLVQTARSQIARFQISGDLQDLSTMGPGLHHLTGELRVDSSKGMAAPLWEFAMGRQPPSDSQETAEASWQELQGTIRFQPQGISLEASVDQINVDTTSKSQGQLRDFTLEGLTLGASLPKEEEPTLLFTSRLARWHQGSATAELQGLRSEWLLHSQSETATNGSHGLRAGRVLVSALQSTLKNHKTNKDGSKHEALDTELGEAEIEFQFTELSEAGDLRIEMKPKLPFLAHGELVAQWNPKEQRLESLDGSLQGLELGRFWPWLRPDEDWRGEGEANLEFKTDQKGLHYRFHLDKASLFAPLVSLDIPSLEASLVGLLDLESLKPVGVLEASLDLPSASAKLGSLRVPKGLFPFSATLTGQVSSEPTSAVTGLASASLRSTSLGKTGLGFTGKAALQPAIGGELELRGSLYFPTEESAPISDLAWRWQQGTLEGLLSLLRQAGLENPEMPILTSMLEAEQLGEQPREKPGKQLGGNLEGSGTWKGTALDVQLTGQLQWQDLAASSQLPSPWQLSEMQGQLRFQGQIAGSMDDFTIRLPEIETRGLLASAPMEALPLQISAALVASPRKIELQEISLDASELGSLSVTGLWSPQGAQGDISFQGAGLRAWRNYLRPLTGELASGLTISGKARGELTAALEEDGRWRVEGPVEIEESGFSSEDGARVLEGLNTAWKVELSGVALAHRTRNSAAFGDGSPTPPIAQLEAAADVEGFLLLWGLFYGDFTDLKTQLGVTASLGPSPRSGGSPSWQGAVRWQLPEDIALEAALARKEQLLGQASPPLSYSLRAVAPDLGLAFDRHLRSPLSDASPRFEALRLSGAITASARGLLKDNRSGTLEGDLTTEGLFVQGGEGKLSIRDFDLELPLDLAWDREGKLREGRDALGDVRFQTLDLGGLRLPPTASPLRVKSDRIALSREVSLGIAGGSVTFTDLQLVDLLQPSRHLSTGIRLEELYLDRLTSALDTLPLEGRLNGQLPRVQLNGSTLEVEGGGEVELFGGTIRVGDISGQDILSRYPKVAFSADLEGIDLSLVTRRFDIGEMTGILNGSIRDCELFRGVPVRFEADIQTVHRPGIKRYIDVKAVKNIAILGTGQSASFLDRGIHKLFDRYTYERLGVEMKLSQDVFLLRGLQEKRGREVFLQGRLPFPIDVVNAQPGRTVSFQTMLRRLQSLDFDTAQTSP